MEHLKQSHIIELMQENRLRVLPDGKIEYRRSATTDSWKCRTIYKRNRSAYIRLPVYDTTVDFQARYVIYLGLHEPRMPLPDDFRVVCADGDPYNLEPSNLKLKRK